MIFQLCWLLSHNTLHKKYQSKQNLTYARGIWPFILYNWTQCHHFMKSYLHLLFNTHGHFVIKICHRNLLKSVAIAKTEWTLSEMFTDIAVSYPCKPHCSDRTPSKCRNFAHACKSRFRCNAILKSDVGRKRKAIRFTYYLLIWKSLKYGIIGKHKLAGVRVGSKLAVHYHDVIMSAMASQITSLTIVYSRSKKENIRAPRHWPLWGEFTGDRWISRTKGQERGKCFHLMTSSHIRRWNPRLMPVSDLPSLNRLTDILFQFLPYQRTYVH